MHLAALAATLATLGLVIAVELLARALRRASDANDRFVGSFAAGVILAFVLLDLFVELASGATHDLHVRAGPDSVHTIAMLMLAGAVFALTGAVYGLERPVHGYVVALVPQVLFRVLIGAALEEESHEGLAAFVIFWLAMALHLGVVEHRLERVYPKDHHGVPRLAGLVAPMIGAVASALASPSLAIAHELLALVAGAIIFAIFEEDMPTPREVNLGAFFAGVIAFGVLVQARWWL